MVEKEQGQAMIILAVNIPLTLPANIYNSSDNQYSTYVGW